MNKDLIILGSPKCPPCNLLKEYLKEENIEFSSISIIDGNIDTIKELMSISKVRSIPQVFKVEDSKITFLVHGFGMKQRKILKDSI